MSDFLCLTLTLFFQVPVDSIPSVSAVATEVFKDYIPQPEHNNLSSMAVDVMNVIGQPVVVPAPQLIGIRYE
jgi:hypothetical protein